MTTIRRARWRATFLAGTLAVTAALPARAQQPDAAAIRAALSGPWQGANTCGTRVDLTLQFDSPQVQGATVVLTGKAKSPPKIDALLTGRYDLANGLLALDATVVPDDPNYCPGVKVLGKCMVNSVHLLGKVITDEQTQRQKHAEERAALAASSAFQAELARVADGAALVGTVRGAAFDCAGFQLTRADHAPPRALALESKETEEAALGRIDTSASAGKGTDAQARMTWLEALGKREDPIAMAELGHAYEAGAAGRHADLAKAAGWYLKAANAGEARAQRRLAAMYAKGEGVPLNPAEGERWLREAKATSAEVGRYCVAPAMIDAYMELFDAAKKDPTSLLLGAGLTMFTGMAVDEGSIRIEGAGVDEVTLRDGPFTCLVLARHVGASVRNVTPAYAYAGEDSYGRSYFYDNSGQVAMNEAIGAFATQMASKVQVRQAFQVQQLGANRLRVSLSQGLVAGHVQTAEVLVDPSTLVSDGPAPASRGRTAAAPGAAPAPVAASPAPAPDKKIDPRRERAVWSLCETATSGARCQAYLGEFPTGPHAGQARGKLSDLGGAADAPAPRAAPMAAPIDGNGKDDAGILAAINSGMQQWSRGWQYDHYLGNTARIQQRQCDGAACQVDGTFEFSRMNQRLTITYTANVERQADGRIAPKRLCYDDRSTSMNECTDF